MSVARKRMLLRFALLAVAAIVGFVLIASFTASPLPTAEHFERISGGMTESQVVELFGPGQSFRLFPLRYREDVVVNDFRRSEQMATFREWRTREGRTITIAFDADGRVILAMHSTVTESWFDKVKRVLRSS